MHWLIVLGILGVEPPPSPSHHTIAEIRHSLNRLDDLSVASLEAVSKSLANEYRALPNKDRYEKVLIMTTAFAVGKLGITLPASDAETVVMESVSKAASSVYDKQEETNQPRRGWYHTTTHGLVWGWPDTQGNIRFVPQEQPHRSNPRYLQYVNIPACSNGRCRVR